MRQTTKFYITSFLKNQTYFTPIFVLMLQFYHLTYQQIFWVYTIGSILSVVIELPTGVFADLYGKKKSIVISKFLIFVSYVFFGFSKSFWMFVLAQAVFELGNSFRTGTETAYTYDFLKQEKAQPSYTLVKGNQKFWARIGEAASSVAGGFIAKYYGFNTVFFIAAIPAFLNFILALTWERIKENEKKVNMKYAFNHIKDSVCTVCSKSQLLKVTLNITVFTAILAAANKFIQPYMTQAGIPIEWFGIIYAVSLGLAAVSGKYSYLLQKRFDDAIILNWLSWISVVPLVILGAGYLSMVGVFLFFVVVLIENLRSPIANTIFQDQVESRQRATMGSVLSLTESFGKMILLPIVGYFADHLSMFSALLFASGILLVNAFLFRVRPIKAGISK